VSDFADQVTARISKLEEMVETLSRKAPTDEYAPRSMMEDKKLALGIDRAARERKVIPLDIYATPDQIPTVPVAWPVGSVFLSVVSTNPATLLGYGTWSQIATGEALVGINTGDAKFDTPEKEGGAQGVAATGTISWPAGVPTINEPNITATGTKFTLDAGGTAAVTSWNGTTINVGATTVTNPAQAISWPAGVPTFVGTSSSVIQPYFVVYVFKRTA
jgi:hypothetical protein